MVLLIGDTDATGYLRPGSLRLLDAIGERSVLSFELSLPSISTFTVSVGAAVILVNSYRIFGGTIEEVRIRQPVPGNDRVFLTMDCTDWHQKLDRRIVVKRWDGETVSTIIDDLLTDYLADEHVWTEYALSDDDTHAMIGFTQPTSVPAIKGIDETLGALTVETLNASYRSASWVLDRLAELAGANWWIDAYLQLHLKPRDAISAPWQLTETAAYRNLVVSTSRHEYRNRQFIVFTAKDSAPRTETFGGDGETESFVTGKRIYSVTSATVSGGSRTVRPIRERDVMVLNVAGAGFTEHPDGGAVKVETDEETDSRIVTIVGTTSTGSQPMVSTETFDLSTASGGPPKSLTGSTTFYPILGVKISSTLSGVTVTVKTATGGQTITSLGGADLSKGVESLTGGPWWVKPEAMIGQGAADTSSVGIKGTDASDSTLYQGLTITGGGRTTFGSLAKNLLELYTGGVAQAYAITLLCEAEWVYDPGTNVIRQSDDGTTLTSEQTLALTYTGMQDAVVQRTNDDITGATTAGDIEALEDHWYYETTGYYERVERVPDAQEVSAAQAQADDLLERFKTFRTVVEFETFEDGLQPGHLLTVILPAVGISTEQFLITSAEFVPVLPESTSGYRYLWRIRAVSSEALGDWVTYFRRLGAGREDAYAIIDAIGAN